MTTAEPGWLLRAWESAQATRPVARGAVLVAESGLVAGLDDALDLPTDELARVIARLHTLEFGDRADGVLDCGTCGAELDVTVPLDLVSDVAGSAPRDSQRPSRTVTLSSGRTAAVRVPTTRDLLAVSSADDAVDALLARCVTPTPGPSADESEPRAPIAMLDQADRAAVDDLLSEVAGAAAIVVRTTCPECATVVSAPVDPVSFLWERVRVAAPALLNDVAELAMSFGWRESDILELSPARRRAYLSLVRGEPS